MRETLNTQGHDKLGNQLALFLGIAAVLAAWAWLGRPATQYTIPPVPVWEQAEAAGGPDVGPELSDGSVGAARSGKWPTVRARHIAGEPQCVACGASSGLNVHHLQPFHTAPELELEPTNLVTLCDEHHFHIGHDPDGPWGPAGPGWAKVNPNCLRDASKVRHQLGLPPHSRLRPTPAGGAPW